jgi:hypothetical protein
MKLQIRVGPDGIIEDAKFKTYGCGSAIASSSLVTEWVKGKTLDQAMTIRNTQIAEELALPPVKIHCSILAEDAIKAAVADYKQKHGGAGKAQGRIPTAGESTNSRPTEPQRRRSRAAPLPLGRAARVAYWPSAARVSTCDLRAHDRLLGLAYKIEYADDALPEDVKFESHGVTVVVDPKACPISTAPNSILRARAGQASSSITRT